MNSKDIKTITIKEKIGKGGYGIVYKGVNEIGKEIAVKCVNIDKKGIECLNEPIIMSIIEHPNINKIDKIKISSNKLYMIQELAISDLYIWRKYNQPTINQIQEWFYGLIHAINFLHKNNIIHGDIKSTNILLYNDNKIKLTDFTFSTSEKWSNNHNNICTITHRPIEVWLDRKWDKKIDIWSLGCTFFEILYGYSLFPIQTNDNNDYSDKYINVLLDWNITISISDNYNYINRKNINYEKFKLPNNFDINDPLNKIIISMLKIDPIERINTEELLSNPIFNNSNNITNCNIISYKINDIDDKIKRKISKYILSIINNSKINIELINLSCLLYNSIKKINNISDTMKIIISIWISYKLITNTILPVSISLSELINYEKKICSYLFFKLPIIYS